LKRGYLNKKRIEMSELKESTSDDNSRASEEDENSEDEIEPMLAYYRMKHGVVDVLKEDFASCMRVNSRVRGFFLATDSKLNSIWFFSSFLCWARIGAKYLFSTILVMSSKHTTMYEIFESLTTD
jgi:hypothetical protein